MQRNSLIEYFGWLFDISKSKLCVLSSRKLAKISDDNIIRKKSTLHRRKYGEKQNKMKIRSSIDGSRKFLVLASGPELPRQPTRFAGREKGRRKKGREDQYQIGERIVDVIRKNTWREEAKPPSFIKLKLKKAGGGEILHERVRVRRMNDLHSK